MVKVHAHSCHEVTFLSLIFKHFLTRKDPDRGGYKNQKSYYKYKCSADFMKSVQIILMILSGSELFLWAHKLHWIYGILKKCIYIQARLDN